MKRFTFLHPLYMSFFSRELYQDIALEWKGSGSAYLICLLALCSIPGVLRIQRDISEFLNTAAPRIVSQMPAIRINKGTVEIDRPVPYFIKDERTGKPFIIIDTTGRINTLKDYAASVLLTKTKIMLKNGEIETKTYDLSEIDNIVIERRHVYEMMDVIDQWFWVFYYPVALGFSFLYYLIEVIIFAALGRIYSARSDGSLRFGAFMRLAAVSITPSAILASFFVIAGIHIPLWWLLSFFISAGYVFFAISAVSDINGNHAL
ncbi:MAG: DUF1189 domain-containing protein [Nitrospirae bacterium]|nr:DUF1189 domain-containing protein [Nitrospirota bacterium]